MTKTDRKSVDGDVAGLGREEMSQFMDGDDKGQDHQPGQNIDGRFLHEMDHQF